MTANKKALLFLEVLCFLLIFSVMGITYYWYIEEDAYQIETITKDVQSVDSGFITFVRYVCPRKQNVSAVVTERIAFEDGASIYVNSYIHPPVEKCGFISVKKLIPDYLKSGNYLYGITVSYDINPLKKMTKVLAPIPFEVSNGD